MLARTARVPAATAALFVAGWLLVVSLAVLAVRPLTAAAGVLCLGTAALGWAIGPAALVLPALAAVLAGLGVDALRHPDLGSGEDPNSMYLLVIGLLLVAAELGAVLGLALRARGGDR